MSIPTPFVNWPLKLALIEKFGSQIRAANAIGLREQRLSYLVRGHLSPSARDRKLLAKALGRERIKKILGGTRHAQ